MGCSSTSSACLFIAQRRRFVNPLVPNSPLVQGRLLLLLLEAVVAGLAEGLDVVFVPELALIAAVRIDMVGDEL